MAIKRMNHAVLYVRSVDRTFAFYRDVLGFRVVNEMPGAKFLQAPDSTNDHDLGIFEIGMAAGESAAGGATVGLYHIAWEVQTLADLREIAAKLVDADALVERPTTARRRRSTARIPTAWSSRSAGSFRSGS